MYDKEAEFRTWLVEERMINPEILSKEQTKKEFARFAEDYNTGAFCLVFFFFKAKKWLILYAYSPIRVCSA